MEYLESEEGKEKKDEPTWLKVLDRLIFPASCVTALGAIFVGFVILTTDFIGLQLNASFNQSKNCGARRIRNRPTSEGDAGQMGTNAGPSRLRKDKR
jgi:hypothetical protein